MVNNNKIHWLLNRDINKHILCSTCSSFQKISSPQRQLVKKEIYLRIRSNRIDS